MTDPLDISDTLAPKSDQLDAVDLLGGAQVFTIRSVSRGNPDQPLNVHLNEFPRPWRPGKSMRRVLAACWGTDASKYVGRAVELYCEPSVKFGGEEVGGTRIRALSNLDKAKSVPLLVSKGRSAVYKVQPLKAPKPAVTSRDRAAKAVAAFAALDVPQATLEAHVGAETAEWGEQEVTALLDVYAAIKAGVSVEEAFGAEEEEAQS